MVLDSNDSRSMDINVSTSLPVVGQVIRILIYSSLACGAPGRPDSYSRGGVTVNRRSPATPPRCPEGMSDRVHLCQAPRAGAVAMSGAMLTQAKTPGPGSPPPGVSLRTCQVRC